MNEKIAFATCKASRTGTACTNPAVASCSDAYLNNFRTARATQPDYEAGKIATAAFQACLPPLTGAENIRDFVACVSYGMLLNIIDDRDGTRFLYAAQVAGSLMERPSKFRPIASKAPQAAPQKAPQKAAA
jgi:hypothetical protein